MKKLISVIIPCYGKDREVVERTLSSVKETKELHPWIEVIFTYNNTSDHNYDFVKNYSWVDQVISANEFENGINLKKIGKISLSLNYVKAKFSLLLDSDDLLIPSGFNDLFNKLDVSDEDLITFNLQTTRNTEIKEINAVFNKSKAYKMIGTNNTLVKTTFLKNNINLISDSFPADDVAFTGTLVMKTTKIIKIENTLVNYIFYENPISRGISSFKVSSLEAYLTHLEKVIDNSVNNHDFLKKNSLNRKTSSNTIKHLFLLSEQLSFMLIAKNDKQMKLRQILNKSDFSILTKKDYFYIKIVHNYFVINNRLIYSLISHFVRKSLKNKIQ